MTRNERPAPTTGPSAEPGPLALAMPLLLFVQGILAWVEGLQAPDSVGLPASAGRLGVTAAILSMATAAVACWLVVRLAETLTRGIATTVAVTVTAFGAGATGAVTLGTLTGLLDANAPTALTAGGPFLVGAGLAVLLTGLTVTGRMPLGSLALGALAAVVLALPFDLVPLGAVLLLIAFGPVIRGPEPVSVPVRGPVPEPATVTPAAARIRPEAGSAAYGNGVARPGVRHPARLG